jgi:hypothetical protein
VIVLGDVHGALSRLRERVALLRENEQLIRSKATRRLPNDAKLSSLIKRSANISKLISVVRAFVWLATILLLPALVQTYVAALDCTDATDTDGSAPVTFTWDRDPAVVCFVGKHLTHYVIPTLVLLVSQSVFTLHFKFCVLHPPPGKTHTA